MDHLAASGVEEREELEVAKLCLTGQARDYFHAGNFRPNTVHELFANLEMRFSRSEEVAMDELRSLK